MMVSYKTFVNVLKQKLRPNERIHSVVIDNGPVFI